MNGKNGRANIDVGFFEDQLYEAQRNLFLARSVRQAKFLSDRINFLRQQLKVNGNGGKKNGN